MNRSQAVFIQSLSDDFYTSMFDFVFDSKITNNDAIAISFGFGYF